MKKNEYDSFPVVEIVRFLGKRVRKTGKGYITNCPFHNDKKASFGIIGNYFKCFACNVSGYGAISFIQAYYNTDFQEAIQILKSKFIHDIDISKFQVVKQYKEKKILFPTDKEKQFYNDFYNLLNNITINDAAYNYLVNKRKLKYDVLCKLGVKWIKDKKTIEPLLQNKIAKKRGFYKFYQDNIIIFPFFYNNEIVYFQGRPIETTNTKYINLVGGVPVLYNIDNIKNSNIVFLAEGVPDTLSLISNNYTAVGMVSTTFKVEWAHELKNKHIVIVIDDDGRFQRYKHIKYPVYLNKCSSLVNKLKSATEKISVCHLPIKTDVNDFLIKNPFFVFEVNKKYCLV